MFLYSRTLFQCTFVQGSLLNSCPSEPTPTPPTTPQECHMCSLTNNVVSPLTVIRSKNKPTTKTFTKKWNCCLSVPDSPDDPHNINNSTIVTEPRCLISLCKHKVKTKKLPSPNLEGRPVRYRYGHWSRAKLRVLFKILGKNIFVGNIQYFALIKILY